MMEGICGTKDGNTQGRREGYKYWESVWHVPSLEHMIKQIAKPTF